MKEKRIIRKHRIKANRELKEKRAISLFEISIMLISVFAFAFLVALATPSESSFGIGGLGIMEIASAQEQSVCCEKTKSGAWCQDAPESECDTTNGLRTTPTSCEATSFCKKGCCYDSKEGTCAENTPERVCTDAEGAWSDSAECAIPQCNLGCCVIGTQAAFVSSVRCKSLSAFYGVNTDFRPDVQSEDACIAIAQSQDQGACVYEKDFVNTCTFKTRGECTEKNATFYKDKLCTAEELNTDCGPTQETTCIEGGDEVYFVDTCGNRANIYDSSKVNDNDYWTNVYSKSESCGADSGTGNANSASCGNCDYLAGSICGKSEFGDAKATYGDNICKDLNCKDTSNGEDMRHGETWCAYDSETGDGKDAVGSRHYRHVCVSGEETIEACDDFRQQTCIQNAIETSTGESFSQAACRANRWQDCTSQTEQEDCENTDKRDCIWKSFSVSVGLGNVSGNEVCVPDVPPGLDFWQEGDAKGICGAASATCEVKFEKGLLDSGWECKENCDCLKDEWAQERNSLCTNLGDCGGYVNYVGKYTDDGYTWTIDGEEKTLPETGKDVVTFTGKVITGMVSAGAVITAGLFLIGFGTAFISQSSVPVPSGNSPIPVEGVNCLVSGTGGIDATGINANAVSITGKITGTEGLSSLPTGCSIGPSGNIAYDSLGKEAFWKGSDGKWRPVTKTGDALFGNWGAGAWAIIQAAGVAGMVYGAISLFGQLIAPDDDEAVKTLAEASTLGTFVGVSLNNLFGAKGVFPGKFFGVGVEKMGMYSLGIGIGIAVIYFVMNYKKEKTQTISFSCMPWQPPTGGDDCEKCNNKIEPCSEYKCKSLGQACQLLNAGTEEEKCAWVNPLDVTSPVISQWDEVLTDGYAYEDVQIRPPGLGMRIENTETEDGCVKAYTPLEFGVSTNEPTQCKIDYVHKAGDSEKNAFESMAFYMDDSNLFEYNHSQTLSMPAVNASQENEINLYIRCEDTNGNFNEDEFAVRFCVEKGPDTTPSKITATSISSDMPVAYGTENLSIELYVNEPSDCRWSREDRDYSSMENAMSCAQSISDVNPDLSYTCSGMLTGIVDRQDNPFYFRCKDQPDAEENERNVNAESYKLTIKGTEPLYITSAKPNNTIIYSSTSVTNISLEAETAFGYKDGESTCYYSRTGGVNDYIMFFNTNSHAHSQSQDLLAGNYTYYIKCIDLGGNTDITTIKFNVSIDTTAPRAVRAYKDAGNLVVATDEEAICTYGTQTCSYTFKDGIAISTIAQKTHKIAWDADTTYYVKCKDKFENQPLTSDCSIVVRAYELG